ncbi:hypothetical protein DMI69_20335 [Escherichia coli]|nr:hypothetical protein [Escherichia coli]
MPRRQVDQLASLGIKVMWVDATSIEQIANALRQLAPRVRPDKAEQAAPIPAGSVRAIESAIC